MRNTHIRSLPIVVLVVVAMILATTVVSARPPAQGGDSEDLELLAQTKPNSGSVTNVVGDDPDENGYAGPLTTAEGVAIEASEAATGYVPAKAPVGLQPDSTGYTGPASTEQPGAISSSEESAGVAPNWESLMAGPQPDKIGAQPASPEWSDFYYFFAAGSAMRPRDSSSGWDYHSGGCVSIVNGNELLTLNLTLPTGARIDYLRIFYYDTSASDSAGWVTNYDGAGGYTDIASARSAGNGGYGTQLSPLVGHVIDNLNHSYILNWIAAQTGASMELCGLRVAYRLPT